MSIFDYDIYENVRTRTVVLSQRHVLLHPPESGLDPAEQAWTLPGGGLEPGESLAECARREVLEETGIDVRMLGVAFLQEWMVPGHASAAEPGGHGFRLHVVCLAEPLLPLAPPRTEFPALPCPLCVPLPDALSLPIRPKEVRWLCRRLAAGERVATIPTFLAGMESPWANLSGDPFERP